MTTIGYIRVSSDQQDANKQRHLLLDYAHRHQLVVNEFIHVELSTRKPAKARKIDILRDKLVAGDQLLVAELSRLGRNMMETLTLITQLTQQQVNIIFVRQPEGSRNIFDIRRLLNKVDEQLSPNPQSSYKKIVMS